LDEVLSENPKSKYRLPAGRQEARNKSKTENQKFKTLTQLAFLGLSDFESI
jgi:hypothetical protein